MKRFLVVLVAVTTRLTVLSPAVAGPSHSAANDEAFVRSMLFDTKLSTFVSTAKAPPDQWFDWSTDFCSAPLVGNTGMSFNFTNSCRRHDFGYRNLQLLERRYGAGNTYWNATNRKQVDRQLLADTRAHCATRALTLRAQCYAWAQTFYSAVRVRGGP